MCSLLPEPQSQPYLKPQPQFLGPLASPHAALQAVPRQLLLLLLLLLMMR